MRVCVCVFLMKSVWISNQVEKNRACRNALQTHFPDTCMVTDAYDLLKQRPTTWKINQLRLSSWFTCAVHWDEYPVCISWLCCTYALVKYCAWSTWGAIWTLMKIVWVRLGPHASLTQGVLPECCCLYIFLAFREKIVFMGKLRMGKQDGFGNETTKELHDISTRVVRKTKLSFHENVTEFEEDSPCIVMLWCHVAVMWQFFYLLHAGRLLDGRDTEQVSNSQSRVLSPVDYCLWLAFASPNKSCQNSTSLPRLCPANFGEPTTRSRAWRILLQIDVLRWNCMYSFDELAHLLLMPPTTVPLMSPDVFMISRKVEAEGASQMTPSASKFYEKYKEDCPDKRFLDLSQNPAFRKRTETTTGALMTLTTSSKIWNLDWKTLLDCSDIIGCPWLEFETIRWLSSKVWQKESLLDCQRNDFFLGIPMLSPNCEWSWNRTLAYDHVKFICVCKKISTYLYIYIRTFFRCSKSYIMIYNVSSCLLCDGAMSTWNYDLLTYRMSKGLPDSGRAFQQCNQQNERKWDAFAKCWLLRLDGNDLHKQSLMIFVWSTDGKKVVIWILDCFCCLWLVRLALSNLHSF